MRPFEDIRVLDLTHVYAGPFCTFQLGVLGADVIKVEPPDNLDMTRDEGSVEALNAAQTGLAYMAQSAGKRSLVLDLKTSRGKSAFLKLVQTADVLVQNYAGGALDRMGLGYEELRAVNPTLIHCSLTGFGRTGPKAEHPAYDAVIQAYTGMMAVNGWTEQDPPLRVGPPVVDYGTGVQAALAISAALFQRQRTGRGQRIDLAMTDAALLLMSDLVVETEATGMAPKPHGNAHPQLPSYSAYEASDVWIQLGAYTVGQCSNLMRVLGFEAEAIEIAGLTKTALRARADQDRALITTRLKEETAQYWEDLLNAAHIPAARIRRIEETLAERQIQSRQVMQECGDGTNPCAPSRLPMAAFTFEHGGPTLNGAPPMPGAHSIEILSEVGLDQTEIWAALNRE